MRLRLTLLVVWALGLQGCGLLAQTTFGWHRERTETHKQTHKVTVSSNVEGTTVLRGARAGAPTPLGVAPIEDEISYDQVHTIKEPKSGWILAVGGLELVGGIALGATVASASNEAGAGVATGVPLMGVGIIDLVVGLIHLASGDEVVRRESIARDVQYLGQVGTSLTSGVVRVPDYGRLELAFGGPAPQPIVEASAPPPVVERQSHPESQAWIVAIMEVTDNNANDASRAVATDLVASLTDQMRVFVAERGVRVIDRGSQEKALREDIMTLKNDSYQQCYDESCQIELGKALAASHILRAHIARFGKLCTLNAELIDLEREVTVSAASAKGACEAEGFLDMAETVAQRIVP